MKTKPANSVSSRMQALLREALSCSSKAQKESSKDAKGDLSPEDLAVMSSKDLAKILRKMRDEEEAAAMGRGTFDEAKGDFTPEDLEVMSSRDLARILRKMKDEEEAELAGKAPELESDLREDDAEADIQFVEPEKRGMKLRVRDLFSNLKEFLSSDKLYGLAAKMGFKNPAAAWSVNAEIPEDLINKNEELLRVCLALTEIRLHELLLLTEGFRPLTFPEALDITLRKGDTEVTVHGAKVSVDGEGNINIEKDETETPEEALYSEPEGATQPKEKEEAPAEEPAAEAPAAEAPAEEAPAEEPVAAAPAGGSDTSFLHEPSAAESAIHDEDSALGEDAGAGFTTGSIAAVETPMSFDSRRKSKEEEEGEEQSEEYEYGYSNPLSEDSRMEMASRLDNFIGSVVSYMENDDNIDIVEDLKRYKAMAESFKDVITQSKNPAELIASTMLDADHLLRTWSA